MVEENLPTPDRKNKLIISTVHISRKEMQLNATDDDIEGKDWAYSQMIEQMPDGDLKDALGVARKERIARLKKSKEEILYVTSNPNPLTDGSDQFAFRAIKRPSEEIDGTYEIISEKGIDATKYSLKYISACWAIDDFLFPNSQKDPNGELFTLLIVYKNGSFRHPDGEPGDGKVYVHNPRDISRTEMSVSEAEEKNIPTLKENLVGVVQIDWEE